MAIDGWSKPDRTRASGAAGDWPERRRTARDPGRGGGGHRSEATYQELFRSLKTRGLSGVRVVICDDHAGLRQAIARSFQGAGWQRCQVHFVRNLLGQVAKSRRAEVAAGLREVFAAPTRTQALAVARRLAIQWRTAHPRRVAEQLEEALEDCLACLVSALAMEQSDERIQRVALP